jgi:hypothetical protein
MKHKTWHHKEGKKRMKEVTIKPTYKTYLTLLKLSETHKEDAIKLLQLFLDGLAEKEPIEKVIGLYTAKDLIEEYLASDEKIGDEFET